MWAYKQKKIFCTFKQIYNHKRHEIQNFNTLISNYPATRKFTSKTKRIDYSKRF